MAGLLDFLTTDPEQQRAITQGLLSGAFGAMAGRGSRLQAWGQGGLAGLQGYSNSLDRSSMEKQQAAEMERRKMLDQLTRYQLDAAGRENQIASLAPEFVRPASIAPEMDARDIGTPGAAPTIPAAFDTQGYLSALRGMDPMRALQMEAAMQKDESPIAVPKDTVLLDRKTRQPVFSNVQPAKDEQIERLKAIYGDGTPAFKAAMERLGVKMTTHTPATTVQVNTEKPLFNTIAQGLGTQIDQSLSAARGAASSISTAQSLKAAVDSGKLIAGPGSSFRVLGLQIGQTLGVGGKDSAEVLSNTRSAIQSMAKAELDAAQMMKGQGQITEAERDIIRRAAAGDIDKLTGPEVRLLADSMEKTARFKIKQHRDNVKALEKMPGAAPLLPFYSIDEPPDYAPPAQERVRRWNPVTKRLE